MARDKAGILRLLQSQTALTFAVRIGSTPLSLLVITLAARVLQPEKLGEYAFLIAVVTIASIPPTIGLRQTVTRETAYAVARGDDAYVAGVWFWALRVAFVAVLVMAAGMVAAALALGQDPALRMHLLFGAGLLFLLPAPKILAGALQGLGRIVPSQLPEFSVRPLVMVAILLPLWVWSEPGAPSVLLVLSVYAIAVLAEALVAGLFLRRMSPVDLLSGRAALGSVPGRSLMFATVSFGAIASVQLINNNLDILMLGILDQAAGTGHYKVATSLSALVSFGLVVVNSVITPRIARMHATGDKTGLQALVTRSARLITLVALAGCAAIVLAGQQALILLFGDSFAAGYHALVILAVGQLANAAFGPVALILNMTGNERLTLIGVLCAVVVNAALNLALIPRLGIEGAAIATASALFAWNLVLTVALWRRTGINSTMLRWQRP